MRKITSIILVITFIIVSVSGVQMVVIPKPQSFHQQMLGNNDGTKSMATEGIPFYPKQAHELAGFLFIGAGLVHFWLNRRPMISYFNLSKK
ncbi:MAG: hypothetical protein H6Q74_2727 [Firmicutes bacterium]|nr:hypothetical protein [Bacillota bacterium]